MFILTVEVLDFVDEFIAKLLFSGDWTGVGLLHGADLQFKLYQLGCKYENKPKNQFFMEKLVLGQYIEGLISNLNFAVLMKAHKKTKQSLLLNDNQVHSKPIAPRTFISSHNSQHRKLLQYKDYLLSLRKMDLAALIQKNNSKKTSSTYAEPPQLIKQPQQTFLSKNQQFSNPSHSHNPQQISKKNQKPIKSPKVKQINLKIEKPPKIRKKYQPSNEQKPVQQLNKPKNSFELILKADMRQDDLYCDQDMQEIIKAPQLKTPKLPHFNNFCKIQTHRDYSTHRSTKRRDLSMPPIEQRNLSEESEESLDKNCNFTTRSISEGINDCKQNSSSYSTPLNPDKQTSKKQNSRRNSQLVEISLVSKAGEKEKMNKTFDNSHIFSTNDFSAESKAENELETTKINKFDLKVSPFNYNQSDFSHFKQKYGPLAKPLNDPQTFYQSQSKQPHKLSLNVSEIVKRINNRQSKSSMSDRSYRKQHQNRHLNNIIHTSRDSHEKIYSDMMKEKFSEFLSIQSTMPLKQIHLSQQISNKKNFKTQVKEFREKHFLMMRLA